MTSRRVSAVVGVGAVAVGTLARRNQEWQAGVGVFGNFWAGRCGTGGQWAVVDRPFLDRLHFALTEMGPNLEQPPPWSMGEAQKWDTRAVGVGEWLALTRTRQEQFHYEGISKVVRLALNSYELSEIEYV